MSEDEDGNDYEDYEIPKKKRKIYTDGGSIGQEREVTSVYRLIMLCIVPNIKDTYDNVKKLFDLISLNNISFKFISDFKLLLIVNGQQTASSSFPCPYCFISLSEMRKYVMETTVTQFENIYNLKTYGDLKNDYSNYKKNGCNKKMAYTFHSTINEPFFFEDNTKYVLQKCIIPELHILQGLVNHLFFDGLVPLLGLDKALLWPKKLKLIPKSYHGDIFEGNACRQLLKKADHLNDPEIYENVGSLRLVPFINTLKAFDKIVHNFFSTKTTNNTADLDVYISNLKSAYKATEISMTLKVHVVFEHLKDCLEYLENSSLGVWSEQAGEAVHKEFLKYWNRFKILSLDSEDYAIRLQKAVIHFSSSHI